MQYHPEGYESAIVNMCAIMDDLRCQDKASKDNDLHIQRRQQEVDPINEMKV